MLIESSFICARSYIKVLKLLHECRPISFREAHKGSVGGLYLADLSFDFDVIIGMWSEPGATIVDHEVEVTRWSWLYHLLFFWEFDCSLLRNWSYLFDRLMKHSPMVMS